MQKNINNHRLKLKDLSLFTFFTLSTKRKATSTTTTTTRPKLEVELTPTRGTLLVHEGVSATTKWIAMLLLFVRVRVIAAIEARTKLWVTEDLVRLVYARHLLLGRFLGEALLRGFVRVVLLGELPVGCLDLSLIGVVGYSKHLVVVFGRATLQSNLSLL